MKRRESLRVYEQRINRILNYISAHPAEDHSLESLAKRAHFSPFHFHRVFKSLVGEPLNVCLRRLRLEKAVFRMTHGPKETLTQIALDCGFSSSSVFSKVFREAYGFPPSRYSRKRLLEESKIRQDLFLNAGYGFPKDAPRDNPDRFRVRLVEWPQRHIAYVRVIGAFEPEPMLAAFNRLMDWGREHNLPRGSQLIGMSLDDMDVTPMRNFRFDWCLEVPESMPPSGDVSSGTIAGGTYAAVRCRGDIYKEARAWAWLFQVWLPRSGYEPIHAPALELYRKDPSKSEWKEFDMDCCLPVRPLR